MLEAIRCEILEKELSLSLAIYEYANIGNEDFFIKVNDKAKMRWTNLLTYGIDNGEFNLVNVPQVVLMSTTIIPQPSRKWNTRKGGFYATVK